MPNMMMDSNVTIHGPICLNVSGKKKPRTANSTTQAANVLPTNDDICASAFMICPSKEMLAGRLDASA